MNQTVFRERACARERGRGGREKYGLAKLARFSWNKLSRIEISVRPIRLPVCGNHLIRNVIYAETSAYSATQLLTQPTKAVAFRSTTFVCAEKKRQNRLDFRQQKKEPAVSARRNPWSVAVAYV